MTEGQRVGLRRLLAPTAYGEIGAVRMLSRFGSSRFAPYTDDDDATTACRSPARRAA